MMHFHQNWARVDPRVNLCPLILTMFDYTTLLEMDLLKRNNLFPRLFTIINNINGNLNSMYGLELLIPSSGTGTRNMTYGENWQHENLPKF